MGLKSANLHRSAEQEGEGKPAVLEPDATDVVTSPRARKGKSQPRPEPVAAVAPALPASPAADDVETLYLEHRTLLLYVACRKFRIPDTDAESLIQEVFLSYLQTGTKIENIRAWLVAAMCNASQHYWRSQARTESSPEDFNEPSDPGTPGLADEFARKLTLRQAL